MARAITAELETHGCSVDAPGRDALDVTSATSVSSYFAAHSPSLLVCNAGVTRDAPLLRLSEDDWDHVIEVNYHGALRCCEAALPAMKKHGNGHLILVSSFSAIHPPVGQAAYATAKAALNGLVADLAVRHGSANIRVNGIMPGFLETRMTQGVSEKRRAEVLNHHSLARFNTCDHVARFIRFLHFELPHTSGQVFQLDSRLASW